MITNFERLNQPETPFLMIQEAISSGLYVSVPCIIQSFNPEAITVTAQPAIRGKVTNSQGEAESVALPLLVDVPVIFPRGGGVTLTFPIQPGDECLVIFADRCIDYWWQNGGIQEPVDPRQHHLSDGFAIVGPQSQAQKISGISTHSAQLRTDDGEAYIELTPGSHNITLNTPGKFIVNAGGGTEINSPEIELNGNLSQGMGSNGGEATMNGPVKVKNDVTAGGISLMNHTHGGVKTGGGTTGGPQ
ncbi:phage baseplate assembly protein V [Xenorhabdus cabanillasii]|uniref:Phage baseplate assembly protein V n=1 Tax=Xenorhabdus cabanillasii TaxID=351673 RepID=A0A3D9URA9_9GAMM|nr:Gp138 family membrane-puncturing spike protein [Xenorhabdus cabanillasii]REF28504.1 phage baseplate assembly protein V [Xenorhabdus cabanillasii]